MMRHSPSVEIHSEVYSARIEALEALFAAAKTLPAHEDCLRAAAETVRSSALLFGSASNAVRYRFLAEFLEQVALLADWRLAVLTAKPESDRFRRAANARAKVWIDAHINDDVAHEFNAIAERIRSVDNFDDVALIASQIGSIPFPIIFNATPESTQVSCSVANDSKSSLDERLTVAFVKFTIDGAPLEEVHFLSPGELHDLDIEVRVSRWPEGATSLIIEPNTVERPGTYEMPIFNIRAPSEGGTVHLRESGRVHLVVPHNINARPFEFKYVAKFLPQTAEQPVAVVGQRTLRLEGVDIQRNPITGYPNSDRKLLEVRDALRRMSTVVHQELQDVMALLAPLMNYANQLVTDNLVRSAISEDEFQRLVRSFLRSQPQIGVHLDEHPHSGGGITDLSFKGIRLELKSESNKLLSLEYCGRFVGQAAAYAVGSGKRMGVLCVLDCSAKKTEPFPVEDGIAVLQSKQGTSPVFIITLLMQGNLIRPSEHSR